MSDPTPSPFRRMLVRIAVSLAAIALIWSAVVLFHGPVRFRVFGQRVTSDDASRPIAVALLATAAALSAYGWGATWANRRAIARGVAARVLRVDDTWIVRSIAAGLLATGLFFSTTTAAGADAYGYVSQADLWLDGRMTIAQHWASEAPWPMARWTFSPLGYRPSNVGDDWLLVPTYSPGLPMVMALAKFAGGQEALYWVVPLSGVILVLATAGIGRRMGAPRAGTIAACLVATSPPVLFSIMSPMSDLPVAAAWTASFFFLLDRRALPALAAGLLAGLAILIRPNLVFLAAIHGSWYVAPLVARALRRQAGPSSARDALVHGVLFSIGAATGAGGVALINQTLSGSPLISGYGAGIVDAFASANLRPNIRNYISWLFEVQTPVVVIGLAAVLLPLRQWWPRATPRTAVVLMGASVMAQWIFYAYYMVFDAWWYLRFLLPSWPFLMLGLAVVGVAVARATGRAGTALLSAGVLALIGYQLVQAVDRHVFDLWRAERRYVTVGRIVREATEPNAAIFSMQHSGTVRYYGGRLSVRYDIMEPDWLDRAVEWFSSRGVHSYLLLDDWELAGFAERFPTQRAVERLRSSPLFEYRSAPRVYLLDLSHAREASSFTQVHAERYDGTRSVPPVAQPAPNLSVANTQGVGPAR